MSPFLYFDHKPELQIMSKQKHYNMLIVTIFYMSIIGCSHVKQSNHQQKGKGYKDYIMDKTG